MIKGKHYKEVTKKNKFGTVYQQKVLVNDDIEHNPKNDKEKRMNDEIIQAKKMGIVWKRNTRLAADYQTMTLAREKFLQEQVKAKAQKEQEDKIQKEKEQKEKVSKFMSESDKAIKEFNAKLKDAIGNVTDKRTRQEIAKEVVKHLSQDDKNIIRKRKQVDFIKALKNNSKDYKIIPKRNKINLHIKGTKEFEDWKRDNSNSAKSFLTVDFNTLTKFVEENAGKGIPYYGILNYHDEDPAQYIEILKFPSNVGVYTNKSGTVEKPTKYLAVHHSKAGYHLVPMDYNSDYDNPYFSTKEI